MCKIAILLLFLVCSWSQLFPTCEQYFKQEGKQYTDPEENEYRCKVYQENVQKLKEIEDFTPAVNNMTDMTEAQVKQHYKTLKVMDGNTAKKFMETPPAKVSSGMPLSLDWRAKGRVTSIKNQGSCGSCWSFATAAYAESKLIIEGRQDINVDLSEQYLLSCTQQSSCNGGFLQYTFLQLTESGIARQSDHPYEPYGFVSPFICWAIGTISVGFKSFVIYDATDNQMQQALQAGPVAISISAGRWERYGSGIMRCQPTDRVDHAVLLVGYTPDYWIVKNQWGSHWGEDGYIRVTKNRRGFANCGIGTSVFYTSEQRLWVYGVTLLMIILIYA